MKYIVINLSGILDTTLMTSLENHNKVIQAEPTCVLLDFQNVSEIEESQIEPLQRFIKALQNDNPNSVAFSNIEDSFKAKLLGSNLVVACFDEKKAAKAYLEKMNSEKPDSPPTEVYPRVKSFFQKGDIYYINCPGCGIKLRIRSQGNHACPSCTKRFFFSDVEEETSQGEEQGATRYEMLTLD